MSKNKRVYISGPMTGYPMKNKELFDLAEAYLQSKGYDTVNPAAKPNEILDRDATPEEYLVYMKQDIYEILYKNGGVDELWLLPWWGESKGALFECKIAEFFNLKIQYFYMGELDDFKSRRNQIRRGKKKLATTAVERA